jgi:acyl-ACP thioesterase
MNIQKTPAWSQDFFAETWPLGTERIFFRRDYRIDDGHNTLISATSYWLLLDLKSRRPVVFSLNDDVVNTNRGKYAMTMPGESFSAVAEGEPLIHHVKFSDLDQNRHVNNAKYAEWIFDVIDEEVLDQRSPSSFAIEYKHEVKSGDTVELRCRRTDENGNIYYNIEGRLAGSGQVCVRSAISFISALQ